MTAPPSHITLRVEPDLARRLRELAAYHGRSISDEMRTALRLHDMRAMEAFLRTADGEQEARDAGDDPAEVRRRLRADLVAVEASTYMPRERLALSLN